MTEESSVVGRHSRVLPVLPEGVLDTVEAPPGYDCEVWSSNAPDAWPKPCDSEATTIIVHLKRTDRDDRRNVLACDEHTPVVKQAVREVRR